MKNKLKLGQAAGVVAFAIIIGAVSMSSSSTVDARTSLKENRTVNAGVALGLTEAAVEYRNFLLIPHNVLLHVRVSRQNRCA